MNQRSDALVAAARFIAEVEVMARETLDLVATVGRLDLSPNAPNVIPGRVDLSLDVRHRDDKTRDRSVRQLLQVGENIAAERGVDFAVQYQEDHPAVDTDSELTNTLDECVQQCGIAIRRMVSGAGHDAEILAQITPVTMLFLRCGGGISHHPDESVLAQDVETALQVMMHFVVMLAAP
jgi:allantoate deiminase